MESVQENEGSGNAIESLWKMKSPRNMIAGELGVIYERSYSTLCNAQH